MKKMFFLVFALSAFSGYSWSQKQAPHFDNEFNTWNGRNDYYNWKVFLAADAAFLKTISRVEYYLDPTFKDPIRIVYYNPANPNFTLCNNGWGEFTLRIKIVFKDARVTYRNDVYRLDLHSATKRNRNYICQF